MSFLSCLPGTILCIASAVDLEKDILHKRGDFWQNFRFDVFTHIGGPVNFGPFAIFDETTDRGGFVAFIEGCGGIGGTAAYRKWYCAVLTLFRGCYQNFQHFMRDFCAAHEAFLCRIVDASSPNCINGEEISVFE